MIGWTNIGDKERSQCYVTPVPSEFESQRSHIYINLLDPLGRASLALDVHICIGSVHICAENRMCTAVFFWCFGFLAKVGIFWQKLGFFGKS